MDVYQRQIETQLYREVHALPNTISSKALMNVAQALRPAWEVMAGLAERARLQAQRQQQIKGAAKQGAQSKGKSA